MRGVLGSFQMLFLICVVGLVAACSEQKPDTTKTTKTGTKPQSTAGENVKPSIRIGDPLDIAIDDTSDHTYDHTHDDPYADPKAASNHYSVSKLTSRSEVLLTSDSQEAEIAIQFFTDSKMNQVAKIDLSLEQIYFENQKVHLFKNGDRSRFKSMQSGEFYMAKAPIKPEMLLRIVDRDGQEVEVLIPVNRIELKADNKALAPDQTLHLTYDSENSPRLNAYALDPNQNYAWNVSVKANASNTAELEIPKSIFDENAKDVTLKVETIYHATALESSAAHVVWVREIHAEMPLHLKAMIQSLQDLCPKNLTLREVSVAVHGDTEFISFYGDSWKTVIRDQIEMVSKIYAENFCISFEVSEYLSMTGVIDAKKFIQRGDEGYHYKLLSRLISLKSSYEIDLYFDHQPEESLPDGSLVRGISTFLGDEVVIVDSSQTRDRMDSTLSLSHEIGHIFGLSHLKKKGCVMAAEYFDSEWIGREVNEGFCKASKAMLLANRERDFILSSNRSQHGVFSMKAFEAFKKFQDEFAEPTKIPEKFYSQIIRYAVKLDKAEHQEDAIRACHLAMKILPDDAAASTYIGFMYGSSKQYEKMAQYFLKTLEKKETL
ncbi:MAG: matrixin family metalloprotease, partial [Bdellovibrionales bacterium]|nr:matrixin family metalloprotease [Bdellovibrionales bacterium]